MNLFAWLSPTKAVREDEPMNPTLPLCEKTRVLDVLLQTQESIRDPWRWTRISFAKNEWGYTCPVRDPKAKAWSLTGALELSTKHEARATRAAIELAKTLQTEGFFPRKYRSLMDGSGSMYFGQYRLLVRFNQHPETTHTHVLFLLDRTITRVENEIRADQDARIAAGKGALG